MRTLKKALGPTLAIAFIASTAACGSCKSTDRGAKLDAPNTYSSELVVRITELGDGDQDWDNRGSIIGLECKVGPRGLRNEWSDGYYEGDLVDCSNGMSYDFEYVKVEVVSGSRTSLP